MTSTNAVPPQPACRIIQNFLLVWLDANMDESKEDFQNSLKHLRSIVASITTFTNTQECFDYLSGITKERAFMIVSGSLGQKIISDIEATPQLDSVYVFCGDQSYHEQWANKVPKIKGVYTKIEFICKELKIDCRQCDGAMTSISFEVIDPSFMYTKLLKEVLLEIEDDNKKSIQELAAYCREQDKIPKCQIEELECEYSDHSPIWWYTGETFIYSMLNRALRLMDADIIVKMGFFIRHLHQDIQNLYDKQQLENVIPTRTLYRGQGLAVEDFEKMKKSFGRLISFNNFLSTSRNKKVSLETFAIPAAHRDSNTVGILFIMTIDPVICAKSKIPFADVHEVSCFGEGEDEILFTSHTMFRVDQIQPIHDKHMDRLWQVRLTLVSNEDHNLKELTTQMRKEFNWTTGRSRLGDILIVLGKYTLAEEVYTILLEKPSSDNDRAAYYNQLGLAYYYMGEYSKALSSHNKALEIWKKALPSNHHCLASSYTNIGLVYYKIGDYSEAK
ncbi:unnamed protein product [Rotaria sp. Silwood2]|nr:unnamed protein product [Rotaria sp. Silwood2]